MQNQNKKFIPYLLKILFLFCGLSSYGSNPLKETLATIQEKAFNGDAHYQGALALFHKHGEYGLSVDLEEWKGGQKWHLRKKVL